MVCEGDARLVTDVFPLICIREAEAVTEDELAAGLGGLGFRLDPSEIRALLQHMDEQRSGHVRKSAFLASQLDWPSMQTDYRC